MYIVQKDYDGSYGWNLHYEWTKLAPEIVKHLPKTSSDLSTKNQGKMIKLRDGGRWLLRSGPSCSKITYELNNIPMRYQQEIYGEINTCAWLSALPLVRSIDEPTANNIIKHLKTQI